MTKEEVLEKKIELLLTLLETSFTALMKNFENSWMLKKYIPFLKVLMEEIENIKNVGTK